MALAAKRRRRGQAGRRGYLGVVGQPGGGGAVPAGVEGLPAKHETKITFQIIVGDYTPKLLTQLAGGSAPDAFYVGTQGMAKLIESKNIIDLTEFAGKPTTGQDRGLLPRPPRLVQAGLR